MQDCLFCKIVKREIPADIVYEDEQVLAFNDINPQAPTHVLVIPKQHIATLNDIEEQDQGLVGRLPLIAARLAGERGHADAGYRVVMNCNDQGGQTVYHIHMHLMAGRRFTWPAG
ncbi:histidine triad nucleotide-binding protein [Billgrantia kenyensis]|uniref:Histidine triad nucleotide-binding protein n=1 Tax=Billgrantia kenyensis TaxID=321266 RepID=A0A7V9W2L1_9GAMM|nr:histidine triad nucleotide-binding protein [Halomonas kenyensis]MBA2779884.1 histidine triad nucleotide-binding protein [Halomonas kenyensis]MCG6662018.1 histidine triad nucleotide-binding protein [Halomonas kenyensis]